MLAVWRVYLLQKRVCNRVTGLQLKPGLQTLAKQQQACLYISYNNCVRQPT